MKLRDRFADLELLAGKAGDPVWFAIHGRELVPVLVDLLRQVVEELEELKHGKAGE